MEFALVFVVFFLVFYGILTYSLVVAAQHSVTLAAQDGARKVLQWQAGSASLTARADAGRDSALYQAEWISTMSAAPVQVAVCGSAGALSSAAGGACSGMPLAQDQIEVTVSYAYGAHPLIPSVPLLQAALMPASSVLSARATVHLGNALGGGG
ncbi:MULTISPECIES: TadE/TadG family type IV pilus assembly protein [Achromobacter]|uniref:TadE/TadG family type IV pilus assembly protein n=1 Tax=Achromobacter TaxID=222 RepID=UPI0009EBDB8D|nr:MULTISPECIES: TadE/TadG family type IV pilus assembly protein [Achromobacter]MBD9380561.1 pilus assembly protein [Achromobacter sp. ACM02]MBD9419704.1 pilus assembly protein [Achromobacter sp. ACM04]MBD9433905.1 pilus assembly protein [Achromobacter sp. ACM03]MBD9476684.1 pilus assembly protein [Achromobacter sp. ACM01]MDQ1761571.1 TadE/TadG family type IV pilus assembly protein [Achromobacter aegrifaciens]